MLNTLFIFAGAMLMVIRGATLATRYAARLAEGFRLSKYTVGFIIIAVISILPETFIAVNAAIQGIPSFGLGMLLGSNVADLTLVFALIVFATGRGLKIESAILTKHAVYPFILLLPLILGADGHFSRDDGLTLITTGTLFYYLALRREVRDALPAPRRVERVKNASLLALSMALLLLGAHFTVSSASALAEFAGISPILIGMLIVGLGTTLPELFFSLESAKKRDDALAVGDILGTVLADATIVVGILAVVEPFFFPKKIIFVTGAFMVLASFVLFHFMRTGKTLSRREAKHLLGFWILFVVIEILVNTV